MYGFQGLGFKIGGLGFRALGFGEERFGKRGTETYKLHSASSAGTALHPDDPQKSPSASPGSFARAAGRLPMQDELVLLTLHVGWVGDHRPAGTLLHWAWQWLPVKLPGSSLHFNMA